jgi:hypothetical protein
MSFGASLRFRQSARNVTDLAYIFIEGRNDALPVERLETTLMTQDLTRNHV